MAPIYYPTGVPIACTKSPLQLRDLLMVSIWQSICAGSFGPGFSDISLSHMPCALYPVASPILVWSYLAVFELLPYHIWQGIGHGELRHPYKCMKGLVKPSFNHFSKIVTTICDLINNIIHLVKK